MFQLSTDLYQRFYINAEISSVVRFIRNLAKYVL